MLVNYFFQSLSNFVKRLLPAYPGPLIRAPFSFSLQRMMETMFIVKPVFGLGGFDTEDVRPKRMILKAGQSIQLPVLNMGLQSTGEIAHATYHWLYFIHGSTLHLGLWLANARPIPKAHSPPVPHTPSDPSFSQLPACEEEEFSQIPPPQWEC